MCIFHTIAVSAIKEFSKWQQRSNSKMETFDSNGAKIALTILQELKKGQRKGYNAEIQCAPMTAVNCRVYLVTPLQMSVDVCIGL